jgi:hypothetical protein
VQQGKSPAAAAAAQLNSQPASQQGWGGKHVAESQPISAWQLLRAAAHLNVHPITILTFITIVQSLLIAANLFIYYSYNLHYTSK